MPTQNVCTLSNTNAANPLGQPSPPKVRSAGSRAEPGNPPARGTERITDGGGMRTRQSLCAKHPLKRPHLIRCLRNNFLAFLPG